MEKIDLEAKSDRELLLLVAAQQNEVVTMLKKHDCVLFNNGWGMVSQVKVLWGIAAGLWAVALVMLRGSAR